MFIGVICRGIRGDAIEGEGRRSKNTKINRDKRGQKKHVEAYQDT